MFTLVLRLTSNFSTFLAQKHLFFKKIKLKYYICELLIHKQNLKTLVFSIFKLQLFLQLAIKFENFLPHICRLLY